VPPQEADEGDYIPLSQEHPMSYENTARHRAQHLRKNMTKEERHLWYDFLKTYPVQFRRQVPVHCSCADFLCTKAMLIIELDGSQHYETSNQAYDSNRTAVLEKKGYTVIRFTNTDINSRFQSVCESIDLIVKSKA